jgi:hypothetical protein
METLKDLSVIDNSLPVLGGARAIYESHLSRVQKASLVASDILSKIEANGGKLTPELDTRIQNFLANCSKAKKELEDARKPVTQTMDLIRKLYTTEENKIDVTDKNSIVYSLQNYRNLYARELIEEQERQRKLAEEKALKSKEEIDIRGKVKNALTQHFLDFIAAKKQAVNKSFEAITLENFDAKAAGLKLLNTTFPAEKLKELLSLSVSFSPLYHSEAEAEAIKNSEHSSFSALQLIAYYESNLSELKGNLLDKLPSKKQELELIAKASAGEKIRLENERLNREVAERKRLDQEAEQARISAESEAEASRLAKETQVLFDQSMSIGDAPAMPETRQKEAITVTHPNGWTEIFAFWFQHEGCKCSLDELEKMTFKKLKTFAENRATEGTKITSKYIRYELAVKSVNRKQVA